MTQRTARQEEPSPPHQQGGGPATGGGSSLGLHRRQFLIGTALLGSSGKLLAQGSTPDANALVRRVLDSDPWGFTGAEITARATVNEGEKTRVLSFEARSTTYEPQLTKSLLRFTAPPDVAGIGFLQIQKSNNDDERYLYLPQLKRSRRISGALRSEDFMGTDFTFADLDRRDLREGTPSIVGLEQLGKYETQRLEVRPTANDSQYSKVELWVRTDNLIPLKWLFFDKSNVHCKTLRAKEIRKIQDKWFITISLMQDHKRNRTTELVLDRVVPLTNLPDSDFSVRKLERR